MSRSASGSAARIGESRDRRNCFVSVVMPVFNESAILRQLTEDVCSVLDACTEQFEIVYVNDGSSDGSRELLDCLADEDQRIVVIHLARNFGHSAAVHAGLVHARGDVVVLMDSDLQDDPGAIPDFLSQWEAGFDVVFAERFNRKESLPKRVLFRSFYRILNAVADSPIPRDAGNFGLISRNVLNVLNNLPERDRYLPGLRCWSGFRQTGIRVERLARHDDQPRVSLKGLFRLAKTAVFSFSSFPLTLFYLIAALSGLVCAASMLFVCYHKAVSGDAVPGWTSTIVTASFFGALNALGISVLGEYVIRIYDQVRARPTFIAESVRNLPSAGVAAGNKTERSAAENNRSQSHSTDRLLSEIEAHWTAARTADHAGK
ncbi:MAG: glycosyltransferase family 2 protein [Planctomycetaceae bacterium]|nr:glycosyltransferase family 2 protein [Planctomycetaceae bacterium]